MTQMMETLALLLAQEPGEVLLMGALTLLCGVGLALCLIALLDGE